MKITAKNKLSEITRISDCVEEFGEQVNLPQKIIFQINICLDEIFTNTITYGYNDHAEHDISLELKIEEDRLLLIKIIDDGVPFNPIETEIPDTNQSVEDRQIGGLGIHIVKSMMDKIEYKRENDKNILVLKKQIKL